jgi:hypothetical protein
LTIAIVVALICVSSALAATRIWGTATALTLPGGTAASTGQNAVNGIACVSAADCVGVGFYDDTSGFNQAMVTTETGGSWPTATQLQLPANAQSPLQNAELASVACTSAGNCVAGGTYLVETTNNNEPMVATETGGSWATATQLQLPANADASQYAELTSIACSSAGNCVGGGEYDDTNGAQQAMLVTETSGHWAAAAETTLPAHADTSVSQEANVTSVACTSAGNCIAGGYYTDTSGTAYPSMIVTETNGVWAQAEELTLPGNSDTAPGGQNSQVNATTCTSTGNCVADGYYRDEALHQQAMVATEAGGVWTPATEVGAPTNAAANPNGNLLSIACTSAGNCVAGGDYNNGTSYQAMDLVESSGVWAQTSEVTLPSNAETTGQSASLDALACTSTGQCVAGGEYIDTNGDYHPMLLSSATQLAVSTSSLPAATDGTAYSEQLAATGGAGDYTWTLSSGSLPAGLTLNTTTGVISGTPNAVGTASFTITSSDPGPPTQTASAALSITAVPGPPPNTLITRSTVSSRRHTATFRFKASGGVLSGFQCALVKQPTKKHTKQHAKAPKPKYSGCKSPKSYKHLKAGHFTFYTRAIGPGGTDHTPATHKFKIT